MATASRFYESLPTGLQHLAVAVYGVRMRYSRQRRVYLEARRALARSVEQRLGLTLANYGLLVEDLDVYRAIVTGRALCRANPQSLAAQSLREAAKLVFERARKVETA